MKTITYIVFIFISTSSLNFAIGESEKGQPALGQKISINTSDYTSDSVYGEKIANHVRNWIEEANTYLVDFFIPENIGIEMTLDSRLQSFPKIGKMKYRGDFFKEYLKKPNGEFLENGKVSYFAGDKAKFVHEYGHLIFNHPRNFEKIMPQSITMEGLKSSETQTPNSGAPSVDDLPYSELLADLFAVLILKDGNIFSANHSGRIFTEKGRPCTEYCHRYQSYFFSSRRLMWDYFERSNQSQEAATFLLSVTFESIGLELEERQKLGLIKLSQEEMENRFEKRIKSKLNPSLN